MITWLVLQINQSMFGAVSPFIKNYLQAVSFIELTVEVIALAVIVAFVTIEYFERRNNGVR